jgi:hypothetical protein
MNDEEIRAHFAEWASPLRLAPPPEVSLIRQRARRRTTHVAAAAGSALGTIALAALVVFAVATAAVPGSGTAGPAVREPYATGLRGAIDRPSTLWGKGRYPAPAAAPYLILVHESAGTAQLVNESTGTVVTTLRPLAAASFTWAAATPRDRLFVLAAQNGHDSLSFDELLIARSGRPERLRRVLPDVVLTAQIHAMTVSPDGSQLAIATMPAAGAGTETIRIFRLSSGAMTGEWKAPRAAAASLSFGPAGQLGIGWHDAGKNGAAGELRILDTSTGRGARPLALPANSELATPIARFSSASLTADGTKIIAVSAGSSQVAVEELDARTGQLVYSVPIGPASALATPYYCGVLWASLNGSGLITQCGREQELITDGRVTTIRLAQLILASPAGFATTFSW